VEHRLSGAIKLAISIGFSRWGKKELPQALKREPSIGATMHA